MRKLEKNILFRNMKLNKMEKGYKSDQTQKFFKARIKKIMRLDEYLKIISAEKQLNLRREIFIIELTYHSWYYTDETKKLFKNAI